MARPREHAPAALGVAERVLELLGEGSFTATYKYAVILGLLDLMLELPDGQDPTTRQLAEKIVQLYWPHTAPYRARRSSGVLRQNNRGQAEIVSAIGRFRRAAGDQSLPLVQARSRDPLGFKRLLARVEIKLIEMPLPRLQFLGDVEDRFLYDIAWHRRDTKGARWTSLRRSVLRYQGGESGGFDNRIRLQPEVRGAFRQLNALLRPFVQVHWTSMVAQFNALEETRLHAFLFGAERIDLTPVRGPLRNLQDDRCFYCGQGLRRDVHVDHFIPWSRYPENGIDNLVVADGSCNGAKRDFLASVMHVRTWVRRFGQVDPFGAELQRIAERLSWERHQERTLTVARFVYLDLPPGARLWREARRFDSSDRGELREVLLDSDLHAT